MSRVAPPSRILRICGAHAYRRTLSLGESRSKKPRHVRPRGSRSYRRFRSVPETMICWTFNASPSLNMHLMQHLPGTRSLGSDLLKHATLFLPWASSITCGMTPSPVLARRTALASSESTTPSLSDLPPARVRMRMPLLNLISQIHFSYSKNNDNNNNKNRSKN